MKRLTLKQGDCLEKMDDIKSGSIDMVLCDPPFGKTKCKWDSVIPLDLMWQCLKRVVKYDGAVVINASQPFTTTLINSNLSLFKYCWVWQKNCPSNIACAKYQPMRYTEDVVVFYQKNPTFNKQMIKWMASGRKTIRGHQKHNTTFKLTSSKVSSGTSGEINPHKYSADFKNPSNLISFNTVRGKKRIHPTQKPVELMEYLINTYTNTNEVVLDFAFGSCTTGEACLRTGRKFVGIELDMTYFELGRRRLGQYIAEHGV